MRGGSCCCAYSPAAAASQGLIPDQWGLFYSMFAMTETPAAATMCCTRTAAVIATGTVLHLLLPYKAMLSSASTSAQLPVD